MRILSGIQPTGQQYHIGNYLGAIKYWIQLQQNNDCFFMVADLHALTVPQDPEVLRKATLEKVAELLALGLEPEVCTIFVQSHILEHTELAWIFNTLTPLGDLQRMTQYKDKAKKYKGNVGAGLLMYPTLMAADILLYQTGGVPVGEDQKQHLEITRNIAQRFNARYGKTFILPEPIIPKEGARIKSLSDPKKKMSKSDPLDSQILLFDEPEAIRRKIAKAVTDTGKEVRYNPSKKPGISNLLAIYSLFAEQPIQNIEKQFAGKGYGAFKKALAELLIEKLEPFQRKYQLFSTRDKYIEEILTRGARRASSIAQATMHEVREKVGLYSAA